MSTGRLAESLVVEQELVQPRDPRARAIRERRQDATGERSQESIPAAQDALASCHQPVKVPRTGQEHLGQAIDDDKIQLVRRQW